MTDATNPLLQYEEEGAQESDDFGVSSMLGAKLGGLFDFDALDACDANRSDTATTVEKCKHLGGDRVEACLFGKLRDRTDIESIFSTLSEQALEEAIEYLTDPIFGSPAKGRKIEGIVTIHVDDVYITGSSEFSTVVERLRQDFEVLDKESIGLTKEKQVIILKWTEM